MELVKRFGRQNIFVERWHGVCLAEEPHGAETGKAQLLKNVDRKMFPFGDGVVVALKYAPGT